MSVPIANAIGKPRIFRPGVTIQAPPIPKNPPIHPTEKPIKTNPGQKMSTPEMGIYIVYHSNMFILLIDVVQ
jgi:hypothetical protein